MKKILQAFLIPVSAIFFTACAGSSAETHYYALSAQKISQAEKPFPYRVVVQKFTADPAYTQTNIVYRESPYDFMFYRNDLWATSPDHQVKELFVSELESSGLFARVEERASEIPDMEISGHLKALEEVDSDSTDRFARVAVEISLRDAKSGKTLWKKSYDEKNKLSGTEPRQIAASASEIVSRFAADAVREMGKVLGQVSVGGTDAQSNE